MPTRSSWRLNGSVVIRHMGKNRDKWLFIQLQSAVAKILLMLSFISTKNHCIALFSKCAIKDCHDSVDNVD